MADLNFINTVKDSLLENFYPSGWDLEKIDACCDMGLSVLMEPGDHWNPDFTPEAVDSLEAMELRMGQEIAREIIETHQRKQELAMILPVGPMGMYKHVVAILQQEKISAAHVTTFNMDEWSDRDGNTMPGDQAGGFELAMKEAFFEPLGELTVPEDQRNFATLDNLPTYPEKINAIKEKGGRLVTVYGIGRACHIAFWEPQIGDEYDNDDDWKEVPYRIGQALHPLTIEQNSLHSFSSRFTLIPCWANTVGPGLFSQQRLLHWWCRRYLSRPRCMLARNESVCYITVWAVTLGPFQLDANIARLPCFYEGIGRALASGCALTI